MRVLVVTPWFPSDKRPGAGVFMLRDAELLQASHTVTVVHLANRNDIGSNEASDRRLASGVRVIRLPFDPLSPASLVRARRMLRRHLYLADVVHSMALHALLPLRLARPTVPWIHTEHWSGLIQTALPRKKRIGRRLLLSSLSAPDTVVAVGDVLAESVRRHTGGEVAVIPNRVVLGSSDTLPEAPELRGDTPLKLIAIGNLIHHKGPIQAVDTVKKLVRLGIPATLTWIGSGPLKRDVLRHAARIGVAHVVNFPGQLAPERIPGALQQGHVFILPTVSETFGVALAEALGHGLPVVSTGYGGHLRFLPSEASRIARARHGESLAAAVVSLISDNERWSPTQILRYAQDKFSEARRIDAYAAAYRHLTAVSSYFDLKKSDSSDRPGSG